MKRNRKEKDRFTGAMFRSMLGPAVLSSLGLAFGDAADAVVVGQRMGATGLAAALPFPLVHRQNHGRRGPGSAGVYGNERVCPRLWKRGIRVLCKADGRGPGAGSGAQFPPGDSGGFGGECPAGGGGAALFGPFFVAFGDYAFGRCGVCGL